MASIMDEFPGTGELPDDMNMTTLLAIINHLAPEDRDQLLRQIDMGSEDELKQLVGSAMQPTHVNAETMYMQFPEYRAHKLLRLYIPPILLLLGTFGNIFSFLILRNKTMTRQSTHHFLAALAIVDSLVLYIGLLRTWLGELTGFDPRDQAEWLCKSIVMLGYSCSDVSVWIIVAVTVERYIVVCHPLQANRLCNVTRAKRVILGLAAVFVVINLHFLWTAGLQWESSKTGEPHNARCDSSQGHEVLVVVVWPWVDALLYGFGPFLIISVLNIIIIRCVVRATSGRMALQNRVTASGASQHSCTHSSSCHQLLLSTNNNVTDTSNNNNNNNGNNFCKTGSGSSHRSTTSSSGATVTTTTTPTATSATTTLFIPSSGTTTTTNAHTRRLTSDSNMRLTVMLLTVSFAFLLTTLPMNVSIIGAAFWNRDADNIPVMVRVKLVSTVAELLMYLNHSVNFFLYCATGQKFRNEVVRMVCGKQRPNALLADHSQHLYCSRMCVASYVEIRRSTDETEL